jgi:hypothetical protein
MAVRITVDIPEPPHDRLRRRAEILGTSIQSLILDLAAFANAAIETETVKMCNGFDQFIIGS